MIPCDNVLNAKVHEALKHPICVESGVCYAFEKDEVNPFSEDMVYLPDYCHDRNTFPEIWETLLTQRETGTFVTYLRDLLLRDEGGQVMRFDLIMAAPRLQAIAFLKSLGQWPDGWEDKP